MVDVTTVALIERRPDISRDLFSRYWRDVHGVMAARIPGFESYTQHHVTPASDTAQPFEGIAIVTFASEDDRQGLVTSDVTRHIHRDEQNVFARALLYNLDTNAVRRRGHYDGDAAEHVFFAVPADGNPDSVIDAIMASAPLFCDSYDLRSGDPAGWNDTDVDNGPRFTALIHTGWTGGAGTIAAAHAYRRDETHVMVEHGFPTPVGLRGLDAVLTIREAHADNQLAPDVVRAIYGAALAEPAF